VGDTLIDADRVLALADADDKFLDNRHGRGE